jgi:hypothetical protein
MTETPELPAWVDAKWITPEWPLEAIVDLRDLWLSGLSLAKIGQRMHRTKNACSRKVAKIGLRAGPSPIHQPNAARPVQRPGKGPTLPPLPSLFDDAP